MSAVTINGRITRAGRVLAIGALALALIGLAGCGLLEGDRTGAVVVPSEPVGIVGAITSIDRVDQEGVWGSLLVEGGEQPPGAASDKASIRITEKTLIARDGRWMAPDDLEVGATVRVWFEGPVAESYPVQGTASFIEVASDSDPG